MSTSIVSKDLGFQVEKKDVNISRIVGINDNRVLLFTDLHGMGMEGITWVKSVMC